MILRREKQSREGGFATFGVEGGRNVRYCRQGKDLLRRLQSQELVPGGKAFQARETAGQPERLKWSEGGREKWQLWSQRKGEGGSHTSLGNPTRLEPFTCRDLSEFSSRLGMPRRGV